MGKRYKESKKASKETLKPSDKKVKEKTKDELLREEEIQKQKEKRQQRKIDEKKAKKQEKENLKKECRKKNIEKKENKRQLKEIEKQKDLEKKELEKKKKQREKQIANAKKEDNKRKKELEKQKKLQEKIKRQEREKRIEQRKRHKEEEDFEYESNTAIKMTLKNNQKRQKEKEQQKINKKRRRIKRIIKAIIVLLIIIAGCIFAFTSPMFNIKSIEVKGNEQVSSNTIESLSGLKEDENIFRFLKVIVKQSIKKEPYIENVEIKRILPGTVQISVEERTKKFSIKNLNNYAIINSQGYILEISQEPRNLPIIDGIITEEEQIEAGNRLEDSDLLKVEVAIKIMDTFKDNDLDKLVTSINLEDDNDCIVTMESEQKTIHLGNKSNLSNKVIYVQAIINETKGAAGDIFVNGDLNNKFKPYFREKIM